MNIQLTLAKEDFEPVLLDLVSRAMQRPITPNEVKSIGVSYTPTGSSSMSVSLEFPPLNPPPPEEQNQ